MKNFINTLIEIISNSPSSVLFIVLGLVFTIATIINLKNKKKIGKFVSIAGWLFIVLFIAVRYISYLNTLFDNLMNNVFMQIFFPNLATYVIVIAITNIIFLYSILSRKTSNLAKVTNAIFFSVIMVFMVYTLEQIISNDINIYSFEDVYSNSDISVLIQSTTIIFTFWIILILSKLIINKLIQKSIDKTIYQENLKTDENVSSKEITNPVENTPEKVEKAPKEDKVKEVKEEVKSEPKIEKEVTTPIENTPIKTNTEAPQAEKTPEPIEKEVTTPIEKAPIKTNIETPQTEKTPEPIEKEVTTPIENTPIKTNIETPQTEKTPEPIEKEVTTPIENAPKEIKSDTSNEEIETLDISENQEEIETLEL